MRDYNKSQPIGYAIIALVVTTLLAAQAKARDLTFTAVEPSGRINPYLR